MCHSFSRIQVPGPEGPGTVILILAGDSNDLLRLELFLEGVTRGDKPADTLKAVHLAAITITSIRLPHGRDDRIYLTVELTEAAA